MFYLKFANWKKKWCKPELFDVKKNKIKKKQLVEIVSPL